jgi:hypothetical protein
MHDLFHIGFGIMSSACSIFIASSRHSCLSCQSHANSSPFSLERASKEAQITYLAALERSERR